MVEGGIRAPLPFGGTMDRLRKNDINFSLINPGIDLVSGLAKGELAFVTTSTEGVKVIKDLSLPALPPDYEELWGLHHEEMPRTAILTTPHCSASECHKLRASRESRTKGLNLHLNSTRDLFGTSEEAIANFAEDLNAFRPQLILCDPVYLHWFALRARELGFGLPPIDLILSSYEYLSHCQRRALERMFECKVRNLYTCTELGGCMLGVECGHGHWHVREDHCIMQIADGMILATTTANRIMPLMRYEVGDRARWTDVDCDGPLSDWPTFEFHGPADATIKVNDWTILTTKDVDDILAPFTDIEFYQCIQYEDGRLEIKLIHNGRLLVEERVEDGFAALLGIRPNVKRVTRLDPEPSLKFRLVKRR